MSVSTNKWRRITGAQWLTLVFFLFLYGPLIALIGLSFNENRSATIWTGFSFDWYGRLLANDDLLAAARNSLIVALSAASLATLISLLAAVVIARNRFPGRKAVDGLFSMPLLVPDIVFAIGALLFVLTIGLSPGLLALVMAHTAFCIPFANLPIRARLQGFDWALLDASADLYASRGRTMIRVLMPLMMPGILAGFLLAFIVSLDDFIVSFFVSGPGSITVPVYVFGLIRLGVTPEVNAIASAIVMISVVMTVLFFFVNSRSSRKGDPR